MNKRPHAVSALKLRIISELFSYCSYSIIVQKPRNCHIFVSPAINALNVSFMKINVLSPHIDDKYSYSYKCMYVLELGMQIKLLFESRYLTYDQATQRGKQIFNRFIFLIAKQDQNSWMPDLWMQASMNATFVTNLVELESFFCKKIRKNYQSGVPIFFNLKSSKDLVGFEFFRLF